MTEPLPPEKEAPFVVIAGADEAFGLGLAVLGCSVIENRPPGVPLRLIVFDAGLTESTRQRLEKAWTAKEVRVDWLRLDESALRDCDLAFHSSRAASCVTLVMDRLLPPEVGRVLYLDADTMVRSSLAPLHELDLEGHPVAAVQDTMIHRIRDSTMPAGLDTDPEAPNFNAGVVLVDLDKWRREGLGERARDLARRFHEGFWSVDQQVLNWMLAGDWKRLPLVWNRMTHVQLIPSAASTCYDSESFDEALHAPRIVHFSGRPKPWQEGCRDVWTPEFVTVMQRTPWAPWRPDRLDLPARIRSELLTNPENRHRFMRRGLRLARCEGLPVGPWYRATARTLFRYPWSLFTFPVQTLARRVRSMRARSVP